MNPTSDDPYRARLSALALGVADVAEAAEVAAHAATCADCQAELATQQQALTSLPRGLSVPPRTPVRQQVLDLSHAPTGLIDVRAYAWVEPVPGVRLCFDREEPHRGFRSAVVWADPGARHPRHRHGGDELILVLQGGLRDERGEYGPGEVCRSVTGSVHSEEVLRRGECFCYVLYYGDLEMLPEAPGR